MQIFGLCIVSDLPSATVRIDIKSLEDGGVYFNMFLKYMQFLDGIRLCRSSGKLLLPPSKEVHHVRPSGLGLGGRGWSADLRPRMVPPPVSVRVVTHSYASTSPTVFGSVGYHQPALSLGCAKGSCATDSFVDMDARRHAITHQCLRGVSSRRRALVSGGTRYPPVSPAGSSCYPRDPCAALRWSFPQGICQSFQRETQPIPPTAWLYGVVFFQVLDRIPFLLSV
jgi:hypothetical protein